MFPRVLLQYVRANEETSYEILVKNFFWWKILSGNLAPCSISRLDPWFRSSRKQRDHVESLSLSQISVINLLSSSSPIKYEE